MSGHALTPSERAREASLRAGTAQLRALMEACSTQWSAGFTDDADDGEMSARLIKVTPIGRALLDLVDALTAHDDIEPAATGHDECCALHAGPCCPWVDNCTCQCTCDVIAAIRANDRARWTSAVEARIHDLSTCNKDDDCELLARGAEIALSDALHALSGRTRSADRIAAALERNTGNIR